MEKIKLTQEEAIDLLPDGEYIHTFRNPSGMIIGAEWSREQILDLIKINDGALRSGETAERMGHGIVCLQNGWVFIETKQAKAQGGVENG